MSLTDAERRMVGGSDVASLLGDSRWGTPLQLYARIVGPAQAERTESYLRRGNVLERAVLELYAAETGRRIVTEGGKLTHPRLSYVRCSLDARALVPQEGMCVVDAKTVGAGERKHFGEPGTDQVRRDILYQMQVYLGVGLARGVVDVPKADVPVLGLSGADLTIYTVDFDAELYGMIEEAIERFWRDHVLPRKPPPATEPLGDLEAVSALYPSHAGDAVRWDALTTEAQQHVADWLKAKARLKRAQLREAGCEALVKMALGSTSEVAGLPESLGLSRLTWRQNKEGTETDWEAVANGLRASVDVSLTTYKEIINRNTTTKPGARPLRAYERKGR
jgi:predicted phage-related endonuclease